MSQCKMLGDAISKLVGAINAHSNDPNSDSEQLNLVQSAQQFIAVSFLYLEFFIVFDNKSKFWQATERYPEGKLSSKC